MQENWKATNGNIEKSPHDFEDQPLRIKLCTNLLGRSMLIPIFSKEHRLIEILHLSRFTIRSRLREIFFPDSASHNFAIHL